MQHGDHQDTLPSIQMHTQGQGPIDQMIRPEQDLGFLDTQHMVARDERQGSTVGSHKWAGNEPEIVWDRLRPEQAIRGLLLPGKERGQHSVQRQLLRQELVELLHKLFAPAHSILVEPLAAGYSGTGVVKARPFYPVQGGGQQVVVKFGATEMIEQEAANYMQYVRHFVGDGRITALLEKQRTAHLGGLMYSFLGARSQPMQDFGTFYAHADLARIKQVLDGLFHRTCGLWYANHGSLQPVNLTEMYQHQWSYTTEQLQRIVRRYLPRVQGQHTLTFTSLSSAPTARLCNPLDVLQTARPIVRSTYLCTTHGDLNQRNILVDEHNTPWLIDFQNTGPGHILCDVAMLDTVIRYQLLTAQQATLDERLELEKQLYHAEY